MVKRQPKAFMDFSNTYVLITRSRIAKLKSREESMTLFVLFEQSKPIGKHRYLLHAYKPKPHGNMTASMDVSFETSERGEVMGH